MQSGKVPDTGNDVIEGKPKRIDSVDRRETVFAGGKGVPCLCFVYAAIGEYSCTSTAPVCSVVSADAHLH